MIGLTVEDVKQINYKLSKLSCLENNRKTEVDLTRNEINYSKCCELHDLLCENIIEDITVEIELARILKKLGL